MEFLYSHLSKASVQRIFHKWSDYEGNLLIFFLFLSHRVLNTHFGMYAGWEWGLEGKMNKVGRGGLNVTDSGL